MSAARIEDPPQHPPLGRAVKRRLGRRVAGLGALALACLGLVLHHDVSYSRVTSGSMEPTLSVGQRVAVDTDARTPRVGEIVVFHPPEGAQALNPVCGVENQGAGSTQPCDVPTPQHLAATFIKRVVAGPGATISIVGGRAVVNGAPQAAPSVTACDDVQTCNFPSPVTVPPGDYYVLGDNRATSDDSRFWGPVPADWIVGTAVRCSLFDTLCHPLS